MTVIFFSRIDGKQQQNDPKLRAKKIWVKNVIILGLFPFLVGFRV